jgi:hypothetical protein
MTLDEFAKLDEAALSEVIAGYRFVLTRIAEQASDRGALWVEERRLELAAYMSEPSASAVSELARLRLIGLAYAQAVLEVVETLGELVRLQADVRTDLCAIPETPGEVA